jgi:hypothetical protein
MFPGRNIAQRPSFARIESPLPARSVHGEKHTAG